MLARQDFGGVSSERARRTSRKENIKQWVERQQSKFPAVEGAPPGLHNMALSSLQIHPNADVKISPTRFDVQTNNLHPIELRGPPAVLDYFKREFGKDKVTTVLSPTATINLTKEGAVKAGLPENVRHFAYMYPVKQLEELNAEQMERLGKAKLGGNVQELDAARMGGFVYLDRRGEVLRINAITGSQGSAGELSFEGPAPLEAEARRKLRDQDRLQRVTLPMLKECGSQQFAWVNPSEFGAKLGPLRANFGAFVYVGSTASRHDEVDAVYFAVSVKKADNDKASDSDRKASVKRLGGIVQNSAKKSQTLFHAACVTGDQQKVKDLLEMNWKVKDLLESADDNGETGLTHAVKNGRRELANWLVEKGAPVTVEKHGRRRPVMDLALEGDVGDAVLVERLYTAMDLLVPCFPMAAGATLSSAVRIACVAAEQSSRLKETATDKSEELQACSDAAQRVAAALVDTLEPAHLASLLSKPRGKAAMRDAVQTGCKVLLGRAVLQRSLRQRWRGILIDQLLTGTVNHPTGLPQLMQATDMLERSRQSPWNRGLPCADAAPCTHASRLFLSWRPRVSSQGNRYRQLLLLTMFVVVPLNMLLLPLVTIWPPLGPLVQLKWLPRLGIYKPDSAMEWQAFDESLELYLPSAYLLDTPLVKFALYVLFATGLAFGLTSVPLDGIGDDSSLLEQLLVVWVVTALFTELQEWYASGSAWYFTNSINTVELGSLFLVSAGVMLQNVGTLQNHAEQSEVAFGVVLMWIAVVLRLLSLTTTFGPLVLMFIKMIADAAKWLALMMAVILAFAAGFYSLFRAAPSSPPTLERGSFDLAGVDDRGAWEAAFGKTHRRLARSSAEAADDFAFDGCADVEAMLGSSMLRNMRLLLLVALEAGDENLSIDCLSETSRPVAATLLFTIYLLASVVLLLNMLIAMMAKTFDKVWEAQAQNYQYIFSLTVVEWEEKPVAPTPLTLLEVPYRLLRYCFRPCCSKSAWQRLEPSNADDLDLSQAADGAEGAYAWDESSWESSWGSIEKLRGHVESFKRGQEGAEALSASISEQVSSIEQRLSGAQATILDALTGLRTQLEGRAASPRASPRASPMASPRAALLGQVVAGSEGQAGLAQAGSTGGG